MRDDDRLRRWGGVAAEVLGWMGAAAGVVALVVRTWAVPWQPAIVFAAFFPWFVAVATIGGVLMTIRRKWIGVALCAPLVLLAVLVEVPFYVAMPRPSHGVAMTVLQANLRVGGADAARVVDRARDLKSSVLTVDELTPAELSRLDAAGITQVFPYRYVAPYAGGAGTGIFSRYPLSDQSRDDSFQFQLLSADVDVPGSGAVTVVAVHLLPPWPYSSSIWVGEIARLLRLMSRAADSGRPVVVSGDFNSTLDNPQLRKIATRGFHDAAEQSGGGIHPTYPTDRPFPPVLTLDHVFSFRAVAVGIRTLTLPGSDHRGLLVRLILPA